MVQCLHELSMCFSDVRLLFWCSSFICCRAGEVGSLDLRSSRALILSIISAGTGSVLIPEGICRDAAFRMMVRNIFSPFWQFVGSCLLLSLSSISLQYRSQFSFFKLKLVRWCMGFIVRSICKLMRIGRWSEPKFFFVCQLVEVIREAAANETSGEDGLALPGSLVGESRLRIPKLDLDIIFSNRCLSGLDSNPGPSALKASALPIELIMVIVPYYNSSNILTTLKKNSFSYTTTKLFSIS